MSILQDDWHVLANAMYWNGNGCSAVGLQHIFHQKSFGYFLHRTGTTEVCQVHLPEQLRWPSFFPLWSFAILTSNIISFHAAMSYWLMYQLPRSRISQKKAGVYIGLRQCAIYHFWDALFNGKGGEKYGDFWEKIPFYWSES